MGSALDRRCFGDLLVTVVTTKAAAISPLRGNTKYPSVFFIFGSREGIGLSPSSPCRAGELNRLKRFRQVH